MRYMLLLLMFSCETSSPASTRSPSTPIPARIAELVDELCNETDTLQTCTRKIDVAAERACRCGYVLPRLKLDSDAIMTKPQCAPCSRVSPPTR